MMSACLPVLQTALHLCPLMGPRTKKRGRMITMMSRGMTIQKFYPVRAPHQWVLALSFSKDDICLLARVQCLSEEDTEKAETDLERQEMIKEKFYLRFPTLLFIPKELHDVIATDYDHFAVVSGAKDRSFVQIYSRTPNPGPAFIEKYKNQLADFGYDPSKIKDTPQGCLVMSNSQLAAMMSMSGMQQALTNQFPDLGLNSAVAFNPFTSAFETLKKLVALYFK